MSSDTPRTDAALVRDKMILTEVGLLEIVDAGTARQLERDLTAALKRAEEAERERDKAHMEIESLKGFIGWKAKPEAEQAAERRLALLREIDHYGVLSEGMKRRIRAEISASTPAP